jgi:hypothetical protein
VGTFKHTHTCTHIHNPRIACHHPSCNSSCISEDPQLWAPSSTGADDDDNITLSSLSGLGRARASCHYCLLAAAFCPASSHSQWQGWVLGPSSSFLLFLLLSPCLHSCCPLILILLSPHLSCPHHCQCHPLHCLSHCPPLHCPVLFIVGLSWFISPCHLNPSRCFLFPPHEQLLAAVVGGAVVVVAAVVVGGLSSHCSITRT